MLKPRHVPPAALGILVVVLALLAFTQGWSAPGFPQPPVVPDNSSPPTQPPGQPSATPNKPGDAPDSQTHPPETTQTPGAPTPVVARGLYLTSHVAGIPQRVNELVAHMQETGLNTFVIDLKDNSGTVPYPLDVPLLKEIGAVKPRIQDLPALLSSLRQKGIYLVARIVVFQDPVLAKAKPEWAIRDHQGQPWRDQNQNYWTNPYNRQVWDYHLALAEEAVRLGFQEVQFDYVRFPDNPQRVAREAVLDNPEGLSRSEAITGFLRYVREKIAGKAFLAADVFGLTTTTADDMGIGQDFSSICEVVDYVCPMVYPSHYYNAGIYGLPIPEANPYQVVKRALRDAKAKARGTRAIIRPWLQDFSLRIHYGPSEVAAQIKAAHEEGVQEWLLWNPANVYTAGVDYQAGKPPGLPANELGRVLILEYHRIGAEEGRWTRTPENFRRDLERLYKEGYRLVSMSDYLQGKVNLPAGLSPVILTFDDSTVGQFRLLDPPAPDSGKAPTHRNGPPPRPLEVAGRPIDPECAVGIILDFSAQHPDFGRAATFYVLFPAPFGQADCWQEKLHYLTEMGMEIGNHTMGHASLKKLAPDKIAEELGRPWAEVRAVIPGYTLNSLALPFGEAPDKHRDLLRQGKHQGEEYRHQGILLVGAEPAPSWASRHFKPDAIPRVQAFEEELGKWLGYLAQHPQDRYVSDGDLFTLTYPAALQDRLAPQMPPGVRANPRVQP